MARIGYSRVSMDEQHPEAQEDRLRAEGCEEVFTDKGISGKLARRPKWDLCLAYLRRGDVLVTVRLDRIGRSVGNLIEVVRDLDARGIDLLVLDQAIDTTTPSGRLIFHVMAAIAEFERDLIRERTMDGLAAARARGRVGGRKPKLSPKQLKVAREMYDAKGQDGIRLHTVAEIAHVLGTTRQTIYRSLERAEAVPA